jgi:hypothetical protein
MTNGTAQTITAATNAWPAVLTVTAHGLSNGDVVSVQGATGNTAINGLRKVVVVDVNNFSMTDFYSGAAVAGKGAYAGSATAYRVMSGLRPGDVEDLLDALSRVSWVPRGGSDFYRPDPAIYSIFGV